MTLSKNLAFCVNDAENGIGSANVNTCYYFLHIYKYLIINILF